jgi:hypothetical protein
VIEYEVAYDALTGQTYQQIKIDPTLLPEVFFLQFIFRNLDDSTRSLYTSQEYRKVNCNIQTVEIKGVYKNYDCLGNKYNEMTDVFSSFDPIIYEKTLRLQGELLKVGYIDVFQRSNKNYNLTTTTKDSFELNVRLLPPEVAEELHTIWLGKHVMIDGVEYLSEGSFEKNNAIGTMFDVKLKFTSFECEIQHEC